MSPLESASDLSISDLIRVLNEKLGLACTKLRETSLPPSLSSTSLESEIDGLEARAHDALRLISSLRNLSQPVNRLPPEILSHIARCLIKEAEEDAISIVPLTHVCRYWRESLISTPENWTLISSRNEDMTTVCLKRAKAAPLEITLDMDIVMRHHSFPHILEPRLQYTRSLGLCFIPDIEKLPEVFPNFPQSMPGLRSLTLESLSSTWDEWSIDPFERFTPALKHLSLTNIPLYPSLLRLRTLTTLTLRDTKFKLHIDILLDFLERNDSLESAFLSTEFIGTSLISSQRQTRMKNQLRHLTIACYDVADAQALVSNIPLRKGAHLEVHLRDRSAGLDSTFANVCTAHLSSPPFPTFFQLAHQSNVRRATIKLRGQGGVFLFQKSLHVESPSTDFTLLPLANVREFRLSHSKSNGKTVPGPPVFNPARFPSLETLSIECEADVPIILSNLLSNPASSPLLKTFVFLNCDLSEEFMEELAKFASERKRSTKTTWLYRVLIIHRDGKFPSHTSIHQLRNHVNVVEIRMENGFPEDTA